MKKFDFRLCAVFLVVATLLLDSGLREVGLSQDAVFFLSGAFAFSLAAILWIGSTIVAAIRGEKEES